MNCRSAEKICRAPDHTREQVPLLTLGLPAPLENGVFSDVARLVEDWFR
jgi:phosphopentomutase